MRIRLLVPLILALAVGGTASAVLVSRPPAFDSPGEAALSVAEGKNPRVLLSRSWGDSRMVLVGSGASPRRLALVLADRSPRGWSAESMAATDSDTSDIEIGSLLIANGPGTRDHPAWTVVFGEISEEGISRVVVQFGSDSSAAAFVESGSYLVATRGVATPTALIGLNDSVEIARVTID